MTRPHPKRPEWFKTDFGNESLWGVPGVALENGELAVHRTHLPMIDPADAGKFLARNALGTDAWAAREAWCAERGIKPRTTQHQAVDFAIDRRGVLLADEMRLGKSLSALLMDAQWRRAWKGPSEYGPLLIVAPLSTRAVWLAWAKKVYPGVEIGVATGKKLDKEVLAKPIVFGHYDIIRSWQALFQVGTLILDEIQLLTNRKSRQSLASALLASKARHVVALSGTPINKFPPDMWNVLSILAPGAWGNYHAFSTRYGDPEVGAHGTTYRGISNEAELSARLSEIMLRRRWRECHADLPPISRSIVVSDLTQAERNKLDIIAGKIKSERANTAANLAAYRKQVTTIKLPMVIQRLERVLDLGEPVVGWTWHRDFAEKIHAKLIANGRKAFVIHGEIPIAQRDARMAAWRAEPDAALIANMAVAGAGIDLSHAYRAVVAELDYTPAMIGQAEMRTYSPDRPMDIEFVVANHLVDQRIIRSLVAKLGASDPLGVGAAIEAIDALRDAVLGVEEAGDLDRLLEDLLAS